MAKTTKKVVAKQGRSDESPEVSPVYFLSLEVENVLCFKDRQVLDLTDTNGKPAQWTVILGDNGVGKTTLLRCLAGMELGRTSIYGGLIESFCPILEKTPAMQPWLEIIRGEVIKATFSSTISATLACGYVLKETPSQYDLTYSVGEIKFGIDYSIGSTSIPPKSNKELICYGYGAIRSLGKTALNDRFKSDNSLGLFSEGAPLINAEEWMLQTDYAYQTAKGELKKRLEKQLDQIFDILKRILPDVEDIHIAPADEENPHPRAEFLTPYGWVHLNSLGLGYRTAIAWMVDLADQLFRRYPNSPDPLAEPAIVLVDEIDLHLHPRWQRTIMDFLTERFPNTQFIVTAHSPLVVQAAQNANIVLLRREGDRVVIDNNPEIIENWRVDQVLTSVFDLQTARPKEVEPLLLRREALLDKSKLSKKDQAELDEITEQLGDLPTAESPQEIKAMNIIRRAAKYLESK
jgi:energy-coupling factor transporter ATP-binding protein EcfA2